MPKTHIATDWFEAELIESCKFLLYLRLRFRWVSDTVIAFGRKESSHDPLFRGRRAVNG